MGLDVSKIKYSGTGPDYEKYHRGLVEVARDNELTPGIVLRFGELGSLIVIAVTDSTSDVNSDYYTHILTATHSDGSINKIYLRHVTNEQAEEYMSIRKPPVPPPMPNFKYTPRNKTTAEVITDNADENGMNMEDITEAIIMAEHASPT